MSKACVLIVTRVVIAVPIWLGRVGPSVMVLENRMNWMSSFGRKLRPNCLMVSHISFGTARTTP